MSLPLDKKFSPKKVTFILVAVWLTSVTAMLFINNLWLAIAAVFLGGALPFAILAIWLPSSRLGKFVQEAASVWQLRIFGVSAFFAYSVYANKWAGDVINEIFGIDSKYFGVSTTVLAVLFAPFGLVYRSDVIGWLWMIFLLIGTLMTYVLPLSLVTPERPALGWKAWVGCVVFVVVGSYFLTVGAGIAKSFNPLVMRFAIWADFNENHLCTNDWASKPNHVIFLGDERVLVYFPKNSIGSNFSVEDCNYKKVF